MGPAETYHAAIDEFVALSGATHAMMHVHVGLAVYLAVQLAVRTRRGSMTALQVVFAAEMANEAMDRLDRGSWNWPDTLSDVALTLMWPAAITLVSSYRRARWEGRAPRSKAGPLPTRSPRWAVAGMDLPRRRSARALQTGALRPRP